MIPIPLQEAECFDRHSILFIKKSKSLDNYGQVTKELNELEQQISLSIGYDKAKRIVESDQYKELLRINSKLYNYVNYAKKDTILASEIDRENYNRHLAKRALQKEFFNDELTEVKIDYENFILFWNKKVEKSLIPKIDKLTDKRKKSLRVLFNEFSKEKFGEVLNKALESDFLTGKTKEIYVISFDWFLNKNNFIKVMEGNYTNKSKVLPNQETGVKVLQSQEIPKNYGW